MFKLIWLIRDRNYWKRRCETLEGKLDAERDANRAHEDEILSRFVTLHGVVGVPAREPEKNGGKPKPHTPLDFEQAMQNLNADQKEMLRIYEEDGQGEGHDLNRIHRDFYQREILGRTVIEEVPQ